MYGRIQLEYGWEQHILGYHRLSVLGDITSWAFGAKKKVYKYWDHTDYTIARIKDYDGKTLLINELMSLNSRTQARERTVNNLADVFSKVGGM